MIRFARGFLGSALLGVASLARAQATSSPPEFEPKPAVEHRVQFRARQVEIDPESGALVLSGNVIVRAHRFRLTSGEQLTLSQSARGLHVKGAGRLGLCACINPPITFGFSAADLAPPTDMLLQGATLRVASVPVLYSPYLWLRSPDRAGLVPPSLAYRGEEGIVAGTGFHVPIANDRGISSLSLGFFGYSRGGGRARVEFGTLRGRTSLAIDHLHQTAFDLRANLGSAEKTGNSVAVRADWLGGERARTSLARIDRVALPSDRVRLGVGRTEVGVVGFQLIADAPRTSPPDEFGHVGPGFLVGRGISLGRGSEAHASLETQTTIAKSGATLRGRAETGVTTAILLAPAILELRARERAEFRTRAEGARSELSSGLGARLGFPLARRYDALIHTVEPLLEATLLSAFREGTTLEPLLLDERTPRSSLGLLFGVETALGEPGGRSAADLRLGGGLAGAVQTPKGVVSGRARADTRHVRGQLEAHGLPRDRSAELTLRTELGDRSRLRMGARADAKLGQAALPRAGWDDDTGMLPASRLDRAGWSAGGSVGLPWGSGFDTELGSDFDLVAGRWLSAVGVLGYRHPCHCLSLALMGSRRVGRESFDAELSVELVP